ncbi:MAG TPA: hypothetical protein VFA91_15045 [Candidatus Polarisedimenticolia bacterium]|nr:hypothetical protein [Candidatus Polarisedimenticolia bacterium]
MQPTLQQSEQAARRQLVLQPLYNGAVRLLGQVAGLLLLAQAGSDLDRQRGHLRVALLQWRELQDAIESDLAFRLPTAVAVAQSIERIGALLERLERRFALSLSDDTELPLMLGELAAIRRILQNASCPQHGLAIVDFAGACCAGAH